MLILLLLRLSKLSKLLFIRQRHYWYIDHLIFVLHITTSLFIVLIATNLLSYASTKTELSAFNVAGLLLNLGWLGYYFISLKRFFSKSWLKSVLYFFVINSAISIVLLVAFLSLFALSVLQL